MAREEYLFTSESVTEGHPDKIADQISDAVLDAILAQDPTGRVACETLLTTGLVVVAGEITTSCYVDIPRIARETIKDVGYTRAKYGFDYETCGVITAIDEQSPRHRDGRGQARRGRPGPDVRLRLHRDRGADAAADHARAQARASGSRQVRKSGAARLPAARRQEPGLVRYVDGKPVAVETVVISTQHGPDVGAGQDPRGHDRAGRPARRSRQHLIDPEQDHVPHQSRPAASSPAGPMGDTGLTGRKIIVDTYGGSCPHGGGAFSGKDPTKVDRSACYMARHVAKNIVAAGLAERAQVQVAYAIGVAEPVSIMVETFGTGKVPNAKLEAADPAALRLHARRASSSTSTCAGRSTGRRPPTATSAATSPSSRGSARTGSRTFATTPASDAGRRRGSRPVAEAATMVREPPPATLTARARDRTRDASAQMPPVVGSCALRRPRLGLWLLLGFILLAWSARPCRCTPTGSGSSEVGFTQVFTTRLSLRGWLFIGRRRSSSSSSCSPTSRSPRARRAPDVLWELEDQLGLPGRAMLEPLIRRLLLPVIAVIAIFVRACGPAARGRRCSAIVNADAVRRDGSALRPRPRLLRLRAAVLAACSTAGRTALVAGTLRPDAPRSTCCSAAWCSRRAGRGSRRARGRTCSASARCCSLLRGGGVLARPLRAALLAARASSSAPPTPTCTPRCRCCGGSPRSRCSARPPACSRSFRPGLALPGRRGLVVLVVLWVGGPRRRTRRCSSASGSRPTSWSPSGPTSSTTSG